MLAPPPPRAPPEVTEPALSFLLKSRPMASIKEAWQLRFSMARLGPRALPQRDGISHVWSWEHSANCLSDESDESLCKGRPRTVRIETLVAESIRERDDASPCCPHWRCCALFWTTRHLSQSPSAVSNSQANLRERAARAGPAIVWPGF